MAEAHARIGKWRNSRLSHVPWNGKAPGIKSPASLIGVRHERKRNSAIASTPSLSMGQIIKAYKLKYRRLISERIRRIPFPESLRP